jgi:hypothetical protein
LSGERSDHGLNTSLIREGISVKISTTRLYVISEACSGPSK